MFFLKKCARLYILLITIKYIIKFIYKDNHWLKIFKN